jgi:class 3 adenylate cyclase
MSTVDDLIGLGVASIGHRRKLLAGIAALRAVPATPAATAPPAAPQVGAERRQLTVMFSDLAGSTALSARLDPEDLCEVIGAYHAAVAGEVDRCGGFVAK